MHKFGGILLVTALLLTGCSSATPPQSEESASSQQNLSLGQVNTLQEAVTYGESLTLETPNLGAKISEWARKTGDLVVKADLPWDTNNELGRDLLSLQIDIAEGLADGTADYVEYFANLQAVIVKIKASI